MKRRTPLRHWSEYLAVQILRACFLIFPIELNLKTARLLGWVWARVIQPKRYRLAVTQLTESLGDAYDHAQLQRIALESMQQFAMTGIELLQSPRLINWMNWPRYARFRNHEEFLAQAIQQRPMILVTGHYGNFELLGQLIACLLGRFSAVMRGMDNPLLNQLMVRTRSHTGLELLYKRGGLEGAEKALQNGKMVGFIADQDAGKKGYFVDFFGRPASTFKSIALLAIQYEAPVVVGYCHRVGQRFQHELGVERIIHPVDWKCKENPALWITQEYTRSLEDIIRRCPRQYLWTHRRWKSRPRTRKQASDSP